MPITADTEDDGGETLTLTFSNASGAGLGDAEATGTILNTGDAAGLSASFPESRFASTRHTGSDDRPQVVAAFAKNTPSAQVTGGTISSFQAHTEDGLANVWIFFVTPDGDGDVTFALVADAACASGGICTAGGTVLTQVPATLTIPGPDDAEEAADAAELTASFSGMPSEHAGEGTFTFGLTFSEEVTLSYKTLRDAVLNVSGGAVRKAEREQQGSNLAWEITVEPASAGAVTIGLPETTDYDASGAICTVDGRPLSHSLSATIAGPVGISVANARVDENGGAPLAFTVTLSRATDSALTVDYATADGSAQAGVNYTAASGTLTFQAGESSQTVNVTVLDDSHNEGEETLILRLSKPSEGRLTDAETTGTIANTDPLPWALLARFGRAAVVHVVEHVEERLQAPREPGFRGRFARRELRRGMERDVALSFLNQLGASGGAYPAGGGLHDPLSGSGALAMPGCRAPPRRWAAWVHRWAERPGRAPTATGCRSGAASWERRGSASQPRSTGASTGWAMASACWTGRA